MGSVLVSCSDSEPSADLSTQGTVPWETRGGAAEVEAGVNALSDLEIRYASNGWGPLERDMSNGEAEAGDGQTLIIGAQPYKKGLGMHPAEGERTWAEVQYGLNGQCDTFSAEVGLDDEIDVQSEYGSAVFQVFADDEKLWQSKVLTGQNDAVATGRLELKGADTLKLVVTNADDGNAHDHASWGAPEVVCQGDDPTNDPVNEGQSEKKLIEYGWDVPTAEYVRDNIQQMEARPFEGITFRIGKRDYVSLAFDAEPWAEDDMQLDVLADIEWGTFTDNFMIVWANTEANWFDDAHWDTVTANMRLLSRALNAADAKGILFDPEFYGTGDCHPWRYGTFDEQYDKPACDYGGRSLEAVEAKVRARGEQFINALESNVDSLDLISLHFLHLMYQQQRWADTPISESKYLLLRAFAEGMLGGADERTRLVEGNEGAYYYDETRQFTSVYGEGKRDVPSLLTSPTYAQLYEQKVDLAFAANIDCPFVTASFADLFPGCDRGLSEEDKVRLFEQNIYNALLHSDEYVWLYSEAGYHPGGYDTKNRMNWWSDPPEHVPPGAEGAIKRAKKKLEQDRALGFNLGRKTESFSNNSIRLEAMQAPQPNLSVSNLQGEPSAQVEITRAEIQAEVQTVELYVDSLLVAEGNQAPYTFSLDTLGSGQHTLFARAFYADGSHTMSNPVTVNIP